VPALLASILAAVLATPAAAADGSAFRLPSRNINCAVEAAELRCDINSGLRPAPRCRYEGDPVALRLSARGRVRPGCASDSVYSSRATVLAYGHTWTRAGFRCTSSVRGLTCRNRAGHGFFLARGGWRAL
jgi:hypothetical protein